MLPAPCLLIKADASSFLIVDANEMYEKVVGREKGDLVGKDVFVAFPENELISGKKTLQSSFLQVMESGKSHSLPMLRYDLFNAEHQQFEEQYWELENIPIKDSSGKVVYILNRVLNISAEILATRKTELFKRHVSKTEALLTQAESISHLGTWELDLATQTLRWSDGVFRMCGYEPGEIEVNFQTGLEVIHTDDRAAATREMESAIQTGKEYEIRKRLVTKTGEIKHIISRGHVLKNVHGEPTSLVGVFQDITEQMQAEEELILSRGKFQSLVQSIDGVIWEADANSFVFHYVSPQAETLLGYTPDEWLAEPNFWSNHIVAEDRQQAIETCHHHTQQGHNHSFTYRMVRKDGGVVWIQDVVTVLSENGKPKLLRGVMVDITQAKKIEQTQLKLQEEVKLLLDNTEEAFVLVDTDLQIISFNQRYQQLYEQFFKKPVVKGVSILDYAQTRQVKDLKKLYERVLTGEEETHELAVPLPKGSKIYFELHYKPARDSAGVIIGAFVTSSDITLRKREEDQLRLLESVVKSTQDAVLITVAGPPDNPALQEIIFANAAFTQLTGFTVEEIQGKTPEVLRGERTDPQATAYIDAKLRAGEPCEVELINYNKEGKEFWVQLEIAPIKDSSGNITHWVSVQKDVTLQRRKFKQKDLLAALSKSFNKNGTLDYILQEVLETVFASDEFMMAELWLVNMDKDAIILANEYHQDPAMDPLYQSAKSIRRFQKGEGLPGITWEAGTSQWWTELQKNDGFVRRKQVKGLPVRNALSLPLISHGEIVGALLLGTRENFRSQEFFTEIALELGVLIGEEISRKKLEGLFDQFFNFSQEILILTKPDGYFRKVNPAFCNLLGYTAEELTSHHFTHFVHPDDLHNTMTEFADSLDGRVVNSFENRYRTKDGRWKWISWSSSDVLTEEGLIFGYGRDITEKKELEELVKNASRLARVGSWEVDMLKKRVYWGPITREIHEVDSAYVPTLEEGIKFYKPGKSREIIAKIVERAITEGTPWDVELEIITAKGNHRWIRAIGTAEMKKGKCTRLYGSFQDIHDRKIAELRHIKVLEERDSILERISEAFFAVDQNWTITFWNHEAERLLGKSKTELLGQNLWEIFPEAVELEFFTAYKRAIETQTPQYFVDFFPPTAQWFEVSAYPSEDGLSVFFRDVTQRKLAEEQLIRKSKQINALAELNTALLAEENWQKALSDTFPLIAEAVEADRVYYYENGQKEEGEAYFSIQLEWCREGISPQIDSPEHQKIYFSEVADFIHPLLSRKPQSLIVENMPQSTTREMLESQGILSLLIIPVFVARKYVGFLGFDDCTRPRQWNQEEIKLLSTLVNNLSYAIGHRSHEAALEQAFQDKSTILESIGDAFFAADKNWGVTYWNQMAEKILMTPKEKVLGKNLWEVFGESVGSHSYHMYHQAIRDKIPVHFEDYFEAQKKWFEISAYPSSHGITVYFKDITLRKEVDMRIRQSNERFEMVAAATNDAIWDWDITNNTLYFGEGYRKLFGMKPGTFHTDLNLWAQNIHPEDRERVQEKFSAIYNNPKEKHFHNEYRFKRANGTYAFVVDKGTILRNHEGVPVRLLGAVQDISDRKTYEDSLKALNKSLEKQAHELAISNKELEQFAYVTSHDLQEPLRMVTSFMSLLQKKYGPQLDAKAHQYIHFAIDGGKRMKQIILDLLEYSTVGKIREEKEEVDLQEILEEIQILFRKKVEELGAKIHVDSLPAVLAHKAPIRQLFQNLINNSLIYHHPDKPMEIQVKVKSKKTHWEFTVADNGIGITPEYHEKIFIIFQRLHTTDSYPGTGMGLAICKKIVEQYGGKIWVESEEGKGSTFHFTLAKN